MVRSWGRRSTAAFQRNVFNGFTSNVISRAAPGNSTMAVSPLPSIVKPLLPIIDNKPAREELFSVASKMLSKVTYGLPPAPGMMFSLFLLTSLSLTMDLEQFTVSNGELNWSLGFVLQTVVTNILYAVLPENTADVASIALSEGAAMVSVSALVEGAALVAASFFTSAVGAWLLDKKLNADGKSEVDQGFDWIDLLADIYKWLYYFVLEGAFHGEGIALLGVDFGTGGLVESAAYGMVTGISSQLYKDILYFLGENETQIHKQKLLERGFFRWFLVYFLASISGATLFAVYNSVQSPIETFISHTMSHVFGHNI